MGTMLLLGAMGGAVVGAATGVPFPLGPLFGAAAAGIALAQRQLSGVRVIASAERLEVRGEGLEVSARWADLRLGFGAARGPGGAARRYAIVADARGRSFAFAELGGTGECGPVLGADGRTVPVVDLREASLLLALVVQRAGAWHVLPEALRAAPDEAQGAAVESAAAVAVGGAREGRDVRAPRRGHPGALAVLAKLGAKLAGALGKLAAGGLKAVKTANLGWAAASAATYGLLFSWKFAAAIMLQLFVHEYGHVHAMRRTGMKVRGMYFVPFLGALAVTEDAFTSRRQQAYVALAGPLWGSALALAPAGLHWATGDAAWATIAAWWALINLFNLLPIAPLDGGRVLHAFAWSYSSNLGLAFSLAGLVGAIALGSSLGFSLIWLVAALGAMELAAEAQSRAGAQALRLLPEPERFGRPHHLYLRAVLGPPGGAPAEQAFLARLERQRQAARSVPMRRGELVRWGLAYAGLALALVVLVWLVRGVPGADAAARILQ